jgi:hypothetical protein
VGAYRGDKPIASVGIDRSGFGCCVHQRGECVHVKQAVLVGVRYVADAAAVGNVCSAR